MSLSNHAQTLNVVMGRSTIGLISLVCIASLIISCDDPPPNNPPSIIGAEVSALCEREEGAFALVEVNFVIEDLEGSDTLLAPFVEYRKVPIPMEASPIPAPSPEELATAKESGVKLNSCGAESCRMHYSWTYDRGNQEHGLIRCAAEDEPVYVRLKDQNDNEQSFQILVDRED